MTPQTKRNWYIIQNMIVYFIKMYNFLSEKLLVGFMLDKI